MTRANTPLRRSLVMVAAATTTLALGAAPQASAQGSQIQVPDIQAPQIELPGQTVDVAEPAPAATADAPASGPESAAYRAQLEQATNAARAANGVGPLAVHSGLTEVAVNWSTVQADQNRMFHNPNVRDQIPGNWRHFGENVLQNWERATPQQLVDQWMRSPGHRQNILNARHTSMGMGAAVAEDGKLYATQVFARY